MQKRFSFVLLVVASLLTLGWAARNLQPDRSHAQGGEIEIPVASESEEVAYPEFMTEALNGPETPDYLANRGYPVEIPGQMRAPAGADLVVEAIPEQNPEAIEDSLLEPAEPLSELPEAKLKATIRNERSL